MPLPSPLPYSVMEELLLLILPPPPHPPHPPSPPPLALVGSRGRVCQPVLVGNGDELLPPTVRRSLKEEAHSLYQLLTHKPKNPHCELCKRAKMAEKRKLAGSYKNTSTRWGQLVTADHVVSTTDNVLGVDGSRDILVIKDAYSGIKSAYPMPEKTADSTSDAIKHVEGDRAVDRLYSDRSGEIGNAIRDIHIVAEQE